MSRLRADKLVNRVGTGAPQLTYGAELPVGYGITGAGDINISGTVTATSVSVNGGSAIPGINTSGTSEFTDVQVGGALTVTGDFTVNGTQTILNTASLEVEDLNVGIASTASKLTDSQLDGAGITIYGSEGDKTLTWDNANSRMAFSTNVYAPVYYGDGSQLQNIISGITIQEEGVPLTTSATTLNFVGSAVEATGGGSTKTVTITGGGIGTETSSGGSITLDLSSAQDHKVTASGITTITVSGGTEGDSHTVRIVNSGIATVGFSTYFLFPSGSTPVLPTASGAISLLSFTVHRVGTAGTQLLAGASLNFS
jgi:hypothetical protein